MVGQEGSNIKQRSSQFPERAMASHGEESMSSKLLRLKTTPIEQFNVIGGSNLFPKVFGEGRKSVRVRGR